MNPANGKPKLWSMHDNRPAAEAEAVKVRKVGLFAQVHVIKRVVAAIQDEATP